MRQVGTIHSEDDALRLADFLLTQGIDTKTEPGADGWAMWVRNEDQLDQAKEELRQFQENPADPRYAAAQRQATAKRKEQQRQAKEAQKRHIDVRARWQPAAGGAIPVTLSLIALSILVTAATRFGTASTPAFRALAICSVTVDGNQVAWYLGLQEIRHGQVWRLVTPIFIHMGWLHIVFNMIWTYDLGSQIEMRRGMLRLLLLVVVIAIVSNLAQYRFPIALGEPIKPSPLFGGMSGVIYGLAGYMWMKGRYDPASGLSLSSTVVMYLVVWFVLCLAGLLGSIANTAHGVGLLTGILLGVAPTGAGC